MDSIVPLVKVLASTTLDKKDGSWVGVSLLRSVFTTDLLLDSTSQKGLWLQNGTASTITLAGFTI